MNERLLKRNVEQKVWTEDHCFYQGVCGFKFKGICVEYDSMAMLVRTLEYA